MADPAVILYDELSMTRPIKVDRPAQRLASLPQLESHPNA